jgi:hypothetical protein
MKPPGYPAEGLDTANRIVEAGKPFVIKMTLHSVALVERV